MKLFTQYSRANLVATILIFLLSSAAFYFAIRYILVNQIDDDLRIEEREIETFVNEHNALPESISVNDQKISYVLAHNFLAKRNFRTQPRQAGERDTYRVLEFSIHVNGKIYAATVAKSLEDTDDLTYSILFISSATILVILSVSFFLNRVLLKRLWKPFYESLRTIRDFRVDKTQSLPFPVTKTEEFVFMNDTLKSTIEQARREYSTLKEFTENASHEMQTPLAIIRSKLDLLIQDENLSELQSKTMQSAYGAIEKLSRLNQSLLLLAKIENNQYADRVPINLKQKVEEKLDAFHELWQNQQITVTHSLQECIVNLNAELTEILMNNLLSNATRHNFTGGFINILLDKSGLTISNSSNEKKLDPDQMFNRFFNPEKKGSYNGLGLSIIRQICDVSGLRIDYTFSQNEHSFTLSW